jgi:hypothetical protein
VPVPSNPADEIFPDTFQAEAFDLVPFDALVVRRAFEPVVLSVAMRSAYVDDGLVPPLEMILAAPSGRHEARELSELPLAVVFTPDEGGVYRVTLREMAHNQWWGSTTVTVEGEAVR